MWRELLWKTVGRSKVPIRRSNSYQPSLETVSNNSSQCDQDDDDDDDSDDDSSTQQQSDSSGISGHYSFQHSSSRHQHSNCSLHRSQDNETNVEESNAETDVKGNDSGGESCWREKFDFTLSLIREPRYLLPETLVAEQLKLTLKAQAFRLEQVLLRQSIRQQEAAATSSSPSSSTESSIRSNSTSVALRRRENVNNDAGVELLRRQLRLVSQRLATLTGRLEVLKAVQQVLPAACSNGGIGSNDPDADEPPDSLETSSKTVTASFSANNVTTTNRTGANSSSVVTGTLTRSSSNAASEMPTSEADLLALLRLERRSQQATKRDYEILRKQYQRLKEELEWRDSGHGDDLAETEDLSAIISDRDRDSDSVQMKPSIALKSWTWRSSPSRQSGVTTSIRTRNRDHESTCSSLESLANSERLWSELQTRERIIRQLRSKIDQLEPSRSEAQLERLTMINKELERKNQELETIINNLTANLEALKTYQILEQEESNNDRTFISSDDNIQRKRTYKVNENKEFIQMRGLIADLQQKENDYKAKIEQLEKVLRHQNNSLPEVPNLEELERHVNYMEEQLESKGKQLTALEDYLAAKDEQQSSLKRDLEAIREENERLKFQLQNLLDDDRENIREKLEIISSQLNQALEANKRLVEDNNRERVLRKKYFNQIEDLKGKIRVYCRLRPLTAMEKRLQHSVADVIDPYTLVINNPTKGAKEFHFDRVFLPEDTQDTVFEDTHTLVRSAFDGYNVCICAYGQTGSGKSHTIIGDDSQPGLAPRTFERIFQLANEHEAQFDVKISASMLELYNDRLIDLLRGDQPEVKLEIKKDKRGIVWVQGSRVLAVKSADQLNGLFRRGLHSRHTGSTRMNDRSSRSHLIVSINIECTSRLHGTVIRGKVSLLDLAGSERFAKSGSSGDQLREASSINKSLSTLGDVISALATEQQHTPYRNSKLTMLMQDSLGGNAKTLLFVTASIAASNLDETVTSLTYASRAKAVTNAAQRNTDCKEIARLKAIINKLRRGEEEVEDFT